MFVIALAVVAASYARTAFGPVQEAVRLCLALSDNQMALLQGPTTALPVVLAAIPLGLLVDRYSRVRLIIVFSCAFTAGSVLTAVATGFLTLLLARCIIGLTATATLTAAFSLLADLCTPEKRGRVSMLLSVSQMAGNSAAFALGGVLLASSGSGSEGWRWTVGWLTAPLVPLVCGLTILRESPRTGPPAEKSYARHARRALSLCRSRAPLLVGVIAMEMVFGALYVWGAPALSRTFALAPARVGTVMAIALMVSGLLGPLVGGMLADRYQRTGGPKRTMLIISGVILLSVPASLFAFAPGAGVASALFVAFMVLVSATIVMGTTVFTIVVPSDLRGLCLAILIAAATLFGLGLAPLSVSLLSSALGGSEMIGKGLSVFGVTTGLLGAAAFALGSRSQSLSDGAVSGAKG